MNSLFNRRKFIKFFGTGVALASSSLSISESLQLKVINLRNRLIEKYNWKPLKLSIPHSTYGLESREQIQSYANYEVKDDLIIPEGFTYNVIASWGDPVGDSRYGFNNDHIGFVQSGKDEAFLVINHETVDFDNFKHYLDTFEKVNGFSLPTDVLVDLEDEVWNLNELSETKKKKIEKITLEAFADIGISIISIKKNSNGDWVRSFSDLDRRISVSEAIKDSEKLSNSTGPAKSNFVKENKIGFDDGLNEKCLGTYWNCSGTTTPWGTILSAEERYDSNVPEGVNSDGSSLYPDSLPFQPKQGDGLGVVLGLAGNKYGWAVEVDPQNPRDYGTKHTMLGRYRHEAFAINCIKNKPLAVFSGCDRKGGHIYKFISTDKVTDINSKKNSALLADGKLYAGKFTPDGRGEWIPLVPEASFNPVLPSEVIGDTISLPHPNRKKGGIKQYHDDKRIFLDFNQETLGELYTGDTLEEVQGAILIDAHFAANAIGATNCPRPEDCEFDQEKGILYFAFTSMDIGKQSDDSPNNEAFLWDEGNRKGDQYRPGGIIKIIDDENSSPDALKFSWETIHMGGEESDGKAGWASPDNLEIDRNGNLWMVTDVSSEVINQSIKDRSLVDNDELRSIYGNNSAWLIPTSGEFAGLSIPFAIGPMESELCGLKFSDDQKTLFLTPQHPGVVTGVRKDMAFEKRELLLKTTEGEEFKQIRKVPIGSNWPSKKPNEPPKPSIVGVRRKNNQSII